jgi:hypothetical protein
MKMFLNQFRKITLPSGVKGAYILVKIHFCPFSFDVKSTNWAYSLTKIISPSNLDPFYIITMPQEFPFDGIYVKLSRVLGQNFLI